MDDSNGNFKKCVDYSNGKLAPGEQLKIFGSMTGRLDVHKDNMEQKQKDIDTNTTEYKGTDKGVKLDQGKPRMSLVTNGFARALLAVGEVATCGAKKYTDDGWVTVENGLERYEDAIARHTLKESIDGPVDADFGLLHKAHRAWNALATLELHLRQLDEEAKSCLADDIGEW